jgi:histidyl-tRNA synthetase
MALSIDLMREFGFTSDDFRIRVSDRNAWVQFATENGVTEENLNAFLQAIDKMERAPEDKTDTALQAVGISLAAVKEFIGSGAEASKDLQAVFENLSARGLEDFVEVDLGIVRGLAYYTGPVFEVFDIGKGMRAVAGGGRYDQLVELIGGVAMPACGFAMGDMVIADLIRESESPAALLEIAINSDRDIDVFVVLADSEKSDACMQVAQSLRESGRRVQFSLADAKVGKQFQAAEQAGAKFAVVVGSEFPDLSLKTLADRSEVRTSFDGLIDLLGHA